jgi:hypothetical protein
MNILSHITVSTFQESSIEIAMAETISEVILEPHSQTIIPFQKYEIFVESYDLQT